MSLHEMRRITTLNCEDYCIILLNKIDSVDPIILKKIRDDSTSEKKIQKVYLKLEFLPYRFEVFIYFINSWSIYHDERHFGSIL